MKKETPFALATTAALSLTGFAAAAPASANQPYEGTVTNCESSGVGSLSYVWNQVYPEALIGNYTGRIDFAPDLDCDTIVLTESLMAEDASMNIIGPGANRMKIVIPYSPEVGGWAFGNVNGSLQISGLTFTGSTALRNSVTDEVIVPAVVQLGDGELIVRDSVFEDFYTAESQSYIPEGLIYAEGSSVVSGVAFNDIDFGYVAGTPSFLIKANYDATVLNSSFSGYIGNTFTEGTLIQSFSDDVILMNNTFDFKVDGSDSDEFINIVNAGDTVNLFGNLFALDNKNYGNILGAGYMVDYGFNIFALGDNINVGDSLDFKAQTSLQTTIAAVALGEYQDNDGWSKSVDIGSNSVAKDFVNQNAYAQFAQANISEQLLNSVLNVNADQRGMQRVAGENIDAGSYEIQIPMQEEIVSERKTIYFDALSAKLSKASKKVLKALIVNGTDNSLRKVVVNGYVQPTSSSANDKSLSRARAKQVRAFLRAQGVKVKIVIKAVGKAKEKSAKGRKVVVTIRYVREGK